MQQITLGNKQIIPLGVWKDMPLYLEKDDNNITLYHGRIPVDANDCPKRSDLGFSELKGVTLYPVFPVPGSEYSVLTGLSYYQLENLTDILFYGDMLTSDLRRITEFDRANVTEDERVVLVNIANRIAVETWQKAIDILSKFDKEKAIHTAEQTRKQQIEKQKKVIAELEHTLAVEREALNKLED